MDPGMTTPFQLSELRRNYMRAGLRRADLHADPLQQLARWLHEAVESGITEPNAMVLSTVSPEGRPSSRTVLLKGLDARGLTFFTNRDSRKGREMNLNPHVSALFPWIALERQVIVTGTVEHVSDGESDEYFAARPYGSRIGALVSRQSEVIPHREWLEERQRQLEQAHPETAGGPQRPPSWGGYRLLPERIEFWQGRPNRLHDRLSYRLKDSAQWGVERLSP